MHLFISGPPGIGKTAVGRELAAQLGAAFLDTDEAIERKAGRPCAEIIKRDGMDAFRAREAEVLGSLSPSPSWTVVATGGGATIRTGNRALMRRLGVLLGLRGSVATVARGLARTMERRSHLAAGPREHAARVLRERAAAYRDVDVTFDVDASDPQTVARAITAWLVGGRGVRIDVRAARPYPVLIRAGLLAHAGEHLRDLGWKGRLAVVCDPASAARHAPELVRSLERAGLRAMVIRVPAGEGAKSARALGQLWRALARAEIGRDGGVIALGGGSTGDLAGLAAATYMRGVPVAQIPTTLLAMVDAAIGGKTAIDLPEGKNLVGAFHSPAAVLADPAVLASLPRRQVASGLAEVVKTAFLADRASADQVRRAAPRALAGDLGATLPLVALSAEMKAAIVGEDERESGLRELLNFGHTMGHAYEAATGYRATHGEAVSIGMVFAAALAEVLDLAAPGLRRDLERALQAARLPVRGRIPARAWALLERDKKVRAGEVRWILPRRVGRFSVVTGVGTRHLRRAAGVVEGAA